MVGAAFAHRHCEQVPFRGRGEVNECFFKASSVLHGVPPPARRGSQVLPATLNDDGVDVQRKHSFVITLSAVTLSLRTALLAMSLSAPLGPTVQSVDGAPETRADGTDGCVELDWRRAKRLRG